MLMPMTKTKLLISVSCCSLAINSIQSPFSYELQLNSPASVRPEFNLRQVSGKCENGVPNEVCKNK